MALADPVVVLRRPRVAEVAGAAPGPTGAGCRRCRPPIPIGRWPSCSPRGPPGCPRGRCSATGSWRRWRQTDAGARGPNRAGPGPAMLASTQFAHVGFTTKLVWYLRLATRTHILERWRADDALRTIAAQRMPSIGGVAPQLALMVRSPEAARHDWGHVPPVVAGGAASPPPWWPRRGPVRRRLLDPLLLDRVGGLWDRHRLRGGRRRGPLHGGPPPARRRGGGPGRGRPPAPAGEVGELWLRSPTQMSGYWRDPEGTAATLVDGWIRTGDLARIDERGLVRLAGRQHRDVHPGRLQRVPRGGRGHPGRPPRRGRGGGRPPPGPGDGRDRRGGGRPATRPHLPRWPRSGTSSPVAWPPTSCPRPYGSSPSSRSPPARSSTAAP